MPACILLEHYDEPEPINVGTVTDLTIRDLAEWSPPWSVTPARSLDPSKPDGAPQKSCRRRAAARHRLGRDDRAGRGHRTDGHWYRRNRTGVRGADG